MTTETLKQDRPKGVRCGRCDDVLSCRPGQRYCACNNLMVWADEGRVSVFADPQPFREQTIWDAGE